MKFIIKRTSLNQNNAVPPCAEAQPERYPFIPFEKHAGIAIGDCVDPLPDELGQFLEKVGWSLEIDNLDKLIAFIQQHGPIIVSPNWWNPSLPEIEIYDGWRE